MFRIYKMENGNKEVIKKVRTIKSVIAQYPVECQKVADEKGISVDDVAGKILFWEGE